MLKVWNVSLVLATGVLAILGTFLVRSGILESIHAFGASTLGIPFLVLIVDDDRRLDRARREPRRVAALRAPARLAAVARGGVPAQQPRARRALLRRLLGHVLPAHLRGADGGGGVGRAAVVQPLHHAAGAGARAALGHRPADRVAPRDRGQPAAQLRAAGRRGRARARRARRRGRHGLRARAADVRVRGVRARRGRAGAVARRRAPGARCRATPCRRALVALVRRNRRRYGGYTVHVGIAVHVRRRRGVVGVPDPAARRAAARPDGADRRLRGHLRAADVRARRGRATGGSSGSTSARGCGCARATAASQVLDTYKSYFPSTDPSLGPVSRFFEGEATSRGRAAAPACGATSGRPSGPTSAGCARSIERGDKVLART